MNQAEFSMRYCAALCMLVLAGCQSGNDGDHHSEPGTCNAEMNSAYVESLDSVKNEAALSNVNSQRIEVGTSYEKTVPSSLDWVIRDGKLTLAGSAYQLLYSAGNHAWDVMRADGVMVGNLAPFRTSGCETVSQLRLTMFVPAEEAAANIVYATL